MYHERKEAHTKFWWENLKERLKGICEDNMKTVDFKGF
jgi:hypothetical protein